MSATPSALAWVDEVIAAARRGATRLPLLQRRPLDGPLAWAHGAPAPASLRRWLAYDAAWFARQRVAFPTLASGQLPTASLTHVVRERLAGTPERETFVLPPPLADASVLVLHDDPTRRTLELMLCTASPVDEPPVLALRPRRDPFGDELPGVTLGLAWPSFGAWLATQAGLIARPRSAIAVEVGREVDALVLARFLGGDATALPLERAKPLPAKPANVPLEPDVVPGNGFKDLLCEALEGNDPARIVALCTSPKAIKATTVLAMTATRDGYEDAAIALLDFDPLAKKAFFNAAWNGRLKVLRACLDRGMDADEVVDGRTPLQCAVYQHEAAAAAMLRAHAARATTT